MSLDARRHITTFLALTAALCLPSYYSIIAAPSLKQIPDLAVIGIMWAPGVAALATRLIYQRNVRGFGWRLGASRYVFFSYLLPPAAALVVYGAVWATGLGGFSVEHLTVGAGSSRGLASFAFWRSVAVAATGGFVLEAMLALGEELGWRGLLVPELARLAPFERDGLVSGSIWVLFHVPGILFAGYHSRAAVWYGLVVFSASFVAISFILAWLRVKSGSVWPAVIFHASHNLFIQNIFDRLTVSGTVTQYLTTDCVRVPRIGAFRAVDSLIDPRKRQW
jgi:membrane protease YdiL (CAAX protease family)